MITDNFGRPVLNLRISLTQRCNLHCPYCHREGQQVTLGKADEEMTLQEVVRLAKVAVNVGIRRIKLTGGEPLLRRDILDIVEGISGLGDLDDLSMTTNGTSLASVARDLRASGLMRVNVSLPSLKVDVYRKLMGGELADVLDGVAAAVDVGLHPVKVNMLVLSGVNQNEIADMIRFTSRTGTVLQLIELEPINLSKAYYEHHHYPLVAVANDLARQALKVEVRHYMQNRRIYTLPGGLVEVVHPIENTEFCSNCTRLRVTSDGKLKPCLMVDSNLVDVLTPMRNGASDDELEKVFTETCRRREPYYGKKLVSQLVD